MVSKDPKLVAFTTQGALKHKIRPINKFHSVPSNQGIYVKRSYIKVKFIGHWCTFQYLYNYWNKMTKGDGKWNKYSVMVTDSASADFFVRANKCNGQDKYDPNRTIVLCMEPYRRRYQKGTFSKLDYMIVTVILPSINLVILTRS